MTSPSGSSVPEAARAAKDARAAKWANRLWPDEGFTYPSDITAKAMALADAEVAAAVAEERAATGRRIEVALLAMPWQVKGTMAVLIRNDALAVVRAALASPGEGEQPHHRHGSFGCD